MGGGENVLGASQYSATVFPCLTLHGRTLTVAVEAEPAKSAGSQTRSEVPASASSSAATVFHITPRTPDPQGKVMSATFLVRGQK